MTAPATARRIADEIEAARPPSPARLEDLDAGTRRLIEYRASLVRKDPQAYLTAALADRAAGAALVASADEALEAVRTSRGRATR